MKLTAKRLLAAGAVGISAIVTPLALTVGLTGVGGAPFSVAGAQGVDQILFEQTAGTPADSFQYEPADGGGPPPQAVTMSGNCATPTGGGAAILDVCGEIYKSTNYVGGSSAASVGSNAQATGVGAISPAWTIDSKSNKGAEALDFSPGSDTSVIGSNRQFTEAQIPVQRKDSGVAQNPSLTVQLVEFDSSRNVLATQNCTIQGGQGTQITADTGSPGTGGNCAPSLPAAGGGFVPTPPSFNTVEVRDLTASTSISVVGPTATFTLGNVVCGGQSIQATNSTGDANFTASLSLPVGAACKTYTSFSSSIVSGQGPTVTFAGSSTTPVQFTVQITWPLEPECQPYSDPYNAQTNPHGIPSSPLDLALPVCSPHHVTFNGVDYYDQTYCQAGNPSPPTSEPQAGLCTANKQYNNDAVSTDPKTGVITTTPLDLNGAPATQIVETWVGYVDWGFW